MNFSKSIINYPLIGCIFLFTGCGSDDGNNTTVPSDPIAKVPPNAVVITEQNAPDIAVSYNTAIVDPSGGGAITPLFIGSKPVVTNLVDLAKSIQRFDLGLLTKSTNTRKQISTTDNCTMIDPNGGGTVTLNINQNDTTGAWNGSMSFNKCLFFGTTLNGTFTIAETCTFDPNVDETCTGKVTTYSFSIENSIDTVVISNATSYYHDNYLTPFDYTGSDTMEIFSQSVGGGYLVETTQEFAGFDDNNTGYPDSGQWVITGAEGTKIRMTAIDDTQFSLETDTGGGYVTHPNSPFSWF